MPCFSTHRMVVIRSTAYEREARGFVEFCRQPRGAGDHAEVRVRKLSDR